MNRKERRAKAMPLKEWQERKRKAQEVKEWVKELGLLFGGCLLAYITMWLVCAVGFVI